MTDYTERFRTLSIPQMQQVLAAFCEHMYVTSKRELDAKIAAILAPAEAVSPCDVGGSCGCAATADPTIIRAAEGVTLEPGEYETPDTHHFTVAVALSAEREPMFGVWGWFVASWSQWVYAVRRVEPHRCAVCGPAFDGLSPEADFRENHQWVSDPAPPQQPAKNSRACEDCGRVVPVGGSLCRDCDRMSYGKY